jgi:type I restriction enzyme M protein
LALDPALRSKVDALWNKLWTGGLSNPMDAIEQFSYLLFLKRMDEGENRAQSTAERRGTTYTPRVPEEMRWRYWSQLPAEKAIEHVRNKVFPWFKELGDDKSSFTRYMKTAEFKISKGSLLIAACKDIDDMKISSFEQDVQGDLYEYLLKQLAIAGRNGQFFTPRHIIRMMVKMIDPQPGERIGDLAAGTAGFLVHAYRHILEQSTPPETIEYNGDGLPHHLTGELLTNEQRNFLQTDALRGYDNDSGMTILRIGSMNLMLHGIESPRFFYEDTL